MWCPDQAAAASSSSSSSKFTAAGIGGWWVPCLVFSSRFGLARCCFGLACARHGFGLVWALDLESRAAGLVGGSSKFTVICPLASRDASMLSRPT